MNERRERRIRNKIARAKGRFFQRESMEEEEVIQPEIFYIDSPRRGVVGSHEVTVSGWYIPPSNQTVVGLRAKNNNNYFNIRYGLNRPDVAIVHPTITEALHSGFNEKIKFENGYLSIEVDTGDGFREIHKTRIFYSTEAMFEVLYNPNLAENYADHQNLIASNGRYFYQSKATQKYERSPHDPRLVAFYLPQFHPIPENDKAWGDGFTEWRNVASAAPRFVGHQQPILPADLGFYDLRIPGVLEQQINLAKQHGVYGFCFYYYWFSGKTLLDEPLKTFMSNLKWDFNFSICWANENWTKKWDGRTQDVIISQDYTEEDPANFIRDVEPILLDPRYIREDGKPVLLVYRAEDLKDPARYVKIWREYFRTKHKLELQLVSVMGFEATDPRKYGFDTGLDFAPQTAFFKDKIFPKKKFPFIDVSRKLLDVNFAGSVADYREIARNSKLYDVFEFPTYKSVTPAWDNDARRKGRGFVFHNSSPDLYATWLSKVLDIESAHKTQPLVFINAWNEWAEGAVLEPTIHYGHAYLNTTTEVLAKFSKNTSNQDAWPLYGIRKCVDASLAVVVHVFYQEEWQYIQKKLVALRDIPYDLFITINDDNNQLAGEIKKYNKDVHIITVPNRGRDVLPFLFLARRLDEIGYKYVLKLHTKKSLHRDDGRQWFEGIIHALLPSVAQVSEVINKLEAGAPMIGPEGHFVSLDRYMGGNSDALKMLLTKIYSSEKAQGVLATRGKYGYFASTMFWARIDAIRPLLALSLLPADFEAERGQIDGTLAHAVERALGIVPLLDSKELLAMSAGAIKILNASDADINYPYAP